MSSYNILARYYDRLTENIDYKVRSEYISGFFSQYGKKSGSVLDLACGTGTLGVYLEKLGYKVTGIDLSEDMLSIASSKSSTLRLYKADITDFNLGERFDCCVSSLDSINHLDDIEAVKRCFNCVYNSLKSGGIFIFDVNTAYKHKEILADNTFVFDEEDFFLCWDNEYYNESNTVRIMLDFFIFNGSSYDRYSEEFFERAYCVDEISNTLKDFEILGIYDELSGNEYKDDSQRIYFVCKRK